MKIKLKYIWSICNKNINKYQCSKQIIVQLCPDGAPIKKKMVYASSASAIKASLGTAKILQFQVRFHSVFFQFLFIYGADFTPQKSGAMSGACCVEIRCSSLICTWIFSYFSYNTLLVRLTSLAAKVELF